MDEEEPSKPPRKKNKSGRCVICNKLHSEGKAILHSTEQDISTLLDAAEMRQDESIHKRLSQSHDVIMDGTVKIAFHKSSRASYTAKHNVHLGSRQKESDPLPSTTQNVNTDPPRCLRADTPEFNIRTQCFICGSSYKRHEKLTPISTGTGSSTREHVHCHIKTDLHCQITRPATYFGAC